MTEAEELQIKRKLQELARTVQSVCLRSTGRISTPIDSDSKPVEDWLAGGRSMRELDGDRMQL